MLFVIIYLFMLFRGRSGMVNYDDFSKLVQHVDAVSLMTYDYSNPMS